MKMSRDSVTLKLAAEINDFVRERTKHIRDENCRSTVASVALAAAAQTFSLVEWPSESVANPQPCDQVVAQVSRARE